MTLITVNLSYYNQTEAILKKHLNYWISYPKDVKDKFIFFIIDDGSKIPIQELITIDDIRTLSIYIYRVDVDLYCNIGGIRNLGATECKTHWYMIIDMDTLINSEMAIQLVKLAESNMSNDNAFKFNRKTVDNDTHIKNNKTHPAVCLIRTKDYWNIGGCDEDFVGHYGYTDVHFWYRSTNKINIIENKDIYLEYDDNGESNIIRDVNHNYILFNEKKTIRKMVK